MRTAPVLATMSLIFVALSVNAQVTEIIDSTGDGSNSFDAAAGIAVDASGNIYVASLNTDNVFRISSGGVITEIIDDTGDGTGDIGMATGNFLDRPQGVAVDSNGNVYVTGQFSDNVFRIATPGTCSTGGTPCTITEIIDATGDGSGNTVDTPLAVITDTAGNVYVGGSSNNVFRITTPTTCNTNGTPCAIAEIIDAAGDGTNALTQVSSMAFDPSGNLYVLGQASDNIFRVAAPTTCNTGGPACTITEIIDVAGDGANGFDFPRTVVTDSSGNVFATAFFTNNLFQINAPGTCSTGGMSTCTITELIDGLAGPIGLGIDNAGNLFIAQANGDVVTRLDTPMGCSTSGTACTTSTVLDATGDGMGNTLDLPNAVTVFDMAVYVAALTSDNAFEVAGVAVPVELMEYQVD